MRRYLLFLIINFVAVLKSNAQFTATTTPSISATQIAQSLAGDGVIISNATLTCPNGATGIFTASATSLGMSGGIALTTGTVITNIAGTQTNFGVNASASDYAKVDNLTTGGDADLAASAGTAQSSLKDMCKLEFDFVPFGDTLQLRYRFGSEEYPVFNCNSTSDVFGIYLSNGPGFATPTNIALIPGTSIPVSVNSINDGTYTIFQNPANCTGLGVGSPFTSLYVDNSSSANIVYNGLTTIMSASALVTPCSTYHLKIAIADLADSDRDSGVFIEGGSLKSKVATIDSIKSTNTISLNTPFVI